ncbi:ABC transporter permease [Synergistaceae bacterium OttesenSCG-928-D05]|nr:ABC transporter permease [Synergistaceae bacterium OttesenSCG-928-D05]
MKRHLVNIYRLGIKELWGLVRDPMLLFLIAFTFTVSTYTSGTAVPDTITHAPLGIIDEDNSQLSQRVISALYPPMFDTFEIGLDDADKGMDNGIYTFVLDIPPSFQADILAGREPSIQLNVDATRMSQAFTGAGYIQEIAMGEISSFMQRYRSNTQLPVDLEMRMRFNPNLTQAWFGSLMDIINNITMMAIILTGTALIREREHGTIEHLLAMPVTPGEIMIAKVWSMGLVVLVTSGASLVFVVQGLLNVHIEGSIPLFLVGVALHLFATTAMGIFMATVARNMPQFAMLLILILLPLQMLSGASTPRESMPKLVQDVMQFAPTTHFVELGQGVLYRGAGIDVAWKQFLALAAIGAVFFIVSMVRFRKTISQMA